MPEPGTTSPKRHDPPSRPVTGALDAQAWLTNPDPNRVYCQADPNDPFCGVPELRRHGWVVESWRKDGPRLVGGDTQNDGDVLTIGGLVVMSRSRELQQAHLDHAKRVANDRSKAIGQPGGVDMVRGVDGRPAYFASNPAEYYDRPGR